MVKNRRAVLEVLVKRRTEASDIILNLSLLVKRFRESVVQTELQTMRRPLVQSDEPCVVVGYSLACLEQIGREYLQIVETGKSNQVTVGIHNNEWGENIAVGKRAFYKKCHRLR